MLFLSPPFPPLYEERYVSKVAPPSVTFPCHLQSLLALNSRQTAYMPYFTKQQKWGQEQALSIQCTSPIGCSVSIRNSTWNHIIACSLCSVTIRKFHMKSQYQLWFFFFNIKASSIIIWLTYIYYCPNELQCIFGILVPSSLILPLYLYHQIPGKLKSCTLLTTAIKRQCWKYTEK